MYLEEFKDLLKAKSFLQFYWVYGESFKKKRIIIVVTVIVICITIGSLIFISQKNKKSNEKVEEQIKIKKEVIVPVMS